MVVDGSGGGSLVRIDINNSLVFLPVSVCWGIESLETKHYYFGQARRLGFTGQSVWEEE
jgi:hypothetical protein